MDTLEVARIKEALAELHPELRIDAPSPDAWRESVEAAKLAQAEKVVSNSEVAAPAEDITPERFRELAEAELGLRRDPNALYIRGIKGHAALMVRDDRKSIGLDWFPNAAAAVVEPTDPQPTETA